MDADVKEIARALTDVAVYTLKECVLSKKAPWPARVNAANALLDRGWGKAPQHITAEVNILDRVSDAERTALLAAIDSVLETIEPGDAGIAESRAAREIGEPEGTA